MPYPKKLLNSDETVALDLHPHWWYFFEAAASLLLAIVAGIAVLILTDSGTNARKYLGIVVVIALVITAVWLFLRYLKWVTTNFVITNDRIIFRQGVVGKSGIEIPLDRVNNVNFSQSAFERLLGAGDLLIESGGEDGQQRFTDVRKPHNVQNLIHAQVEGKSRQRGAYSAAPVGAVDVASQLEKLEGLLQRGSLSQAEFDAQKQRLLGS